MGSCPQSGCKHQGVTNLGLAALQVMMDCMCEAGREVLNDPEKVKDPMSFITAILSLKQKSPPRDSMGLKMIEDDHLRYPCYPAVLGAAG